MCPFCDANLRLNLVSAMDSDFVICRRCLTEYPLRESSDCGRCKAFFVWIRGAMEGIIFWQCSDCNDMWATRDASPNPFLEERAI